MSSPVSSSDQLRTPRQKGLASCTPPKSQR